MQNNFNSGLEDVIFTLIKLINLLGKSYHTSHKSIDTTHIYFHIHTLLQRYMEYRYNFLRLLIITMYIHT